ncbi:MAG: accessory factor UbiK family protein [Arenicella sp.]
MNDPKEFLEKAVASIQSALPTSLGDDIKTNITAVVSKALKELDVVSREELEVQMAVLAKTREKLEMLEVKLTDLEKKL